MRGVDVIVGRWWWRERRRVGEAGTPDARGGISGDVAVVRAVEGEATGWVEEGEGEGGAQVRPSIRLHPSGYGGQAARRQS